MARAAVLAIDAKGFANGATRALAQRRAYGTYRCADGTYVICTNPLSDAEMAACKRTPQTFFGIIKDVSHTADKAPQECSDLVNESRAQQASISLKIYPGATHDFDDPGASRQDIPANTAATRDATADAIEFLASVLKH